MSTLTVRDVMTRQLVTLDDGATLQDARDAMRRDHIRHVPIVSSGRLVGLLSHRDLVRAQVESPTARNLGAPVRTAMTREVRTVTPDTPLLAAAQRMQELKLGCLPVVEEGGTLVGILTEADFLRLVIRQLEDPGA